MKRRKRDRGDVKMEHKIMELNVAEQNREREQNETQQTLPL